jgi:tryptophan halogenase
LVYSSQFVSDDEARAALLGRLDGEMLSEPRVIRYRTGRRCKAWEKNCIALGLASGFVEPLESTSIHLIMTGVVRLMRLFPFGGITDSLAQRYNEDAKTELERVRDFIVLHYNLTERTDTPFWQRCRDMEIPESLAQRIALFREAAHAYQGADELFRVDSWVQVMLGQRLEPQGYHHLGRLMSADQLRRTLDGLRSSIARAVQQLPQHQEFIDRYCAQVGSTTA